MKGSRKKHRELVDIGLQKKMENPKKCPFLGSKNVFS